MSDRNSQMPLKLNRAIPFVDMTFRIIEGTASIAEVVNILRDAETANQVKLLTQSPDPPPKEIPVESYAELVEERMHNFLTTTHLVLGSYHYSQLSVILIDDYTYAWTDREWGYMIAKWATETKWLGVDTWNYLDFYGGPNNLVIEHYNEWSEMAMQVIAAKCAL